MKFRKPLTKEQLKAGDLIEPGIYSFTVAEAKEGYSKTGNPQIKVKLDIFLADGRVRPVFDYLSEALEFKVGKFFEAVGLYDKYQAGDVADYEIVGLSGICKIYTQKDKTGQYGDQSRVADYLMSEDASNAAPATTVDPSFNQDVPF